MEDALRLAGDGLSIAALAIIWSVTMNAWKRIPATVQVPVAGGKSRTGKAAALLTLPILTTLILFAPTIAGLTHEPGSDINALLIFCLRALVGAVAGMVHLTHVRSAMAVLEAEGALKD